MENTASRILNRIALLLATASIPIASQAQFITPDDLLDQPWPAPDYRVEYGDDALQYGNLRLPEGDGPFPVIAFVHGGCYLSMYDIQHVGPAAEALTREGFAVWSLEYRRVGDEGGGWPNSFIDVARGIDHLRVLAADHDLDLSRVYAMGHSAGANYAIWAAARALIPRSSEVYIENPLPIAGVLGLTPAPALGALYHAGVCGGVIGGLMGGSPSEYPARYDAVSPMRLMPDAVPQRLIVGVHDANWEPSGRAYYWAAIVDGGSEVELIEAPESGHFEVVAPWSSSWQLVIEQLQLLLSQ